MHITTNAHVQVCYGRVLESKFPGNERDMCTVMKLEKDQWTKLPDYIAQYFAMTSLANRLDLGWWEDL